MKDDFHIHSCFSDGMYDTSRLFKLIKEAQIEFFSITDHNNISAVKKLINSPNIVSGVELTSVIPIYSSLEEVHVLAYNFDVNSTIINKLLRDFNEENTYSFIQGLKILEKDHKIFIPREEIENLVKNGVTITKLQMCELLVKYGYAKDIYIAYKNYIKSSEEKCKRIQLDLRTVIDTIKDANGYAILAHHWIYTLLNKDYSNYKKMLTMGLDGFELNLDNESNKHFNNLVKSNGLLYSVGSDFHGLTSNTNTLGKDVNNAINDEHYIGNIARKRKR